MICRIVEADATTGRGRKAALAIRRCRAVVEALVDSVAAGREQIGERNVVFELVL